MRRREFIAVLGGAAAWPLTVRAQQSSARRVGIVSPLSPSAAAPLVPLRFFAKHFSTSAT